MSAQSDTSLNYLDPAVLAKIIGLELRARRVVEGFLSGMHHSPRHGFSIEFADHRVYTQGDDLRHIDWKVFGRTDKYYIKEYEQEANLNLMLLVDCSESMNYRSSPDGMTKHEYATCLAAAIAYLAIQQQDSVGLALFDERLTRLIKPSNHTQQWKTLAHELSGRTGNAKTAIGRVFTELAERLTHRTMVIIISDLFDETEGVVKGLRQLRYRGHEPIVWNLWDDAELTFPFQGPTLFEGLEATGTLLSDPGALRERYLEEVRRFQDDLRFACGHMHVDYAVFNTAQSLGVALANYLGTRGARLRQRSVRTMGAGARPVKES